MKNTPAADIKSLESAKLYVVTIDAVKTGDGTETYLVGVFSNKETAKEAGSRAAKTVGNSYYLTECNLDEEYPLTPVMFQNKNYLGGAIL